jgi:hypothetical protein
MTPRREVVAIWAMLVPARNTSENTSAVTAKQRLVTFPPKRLAGAAWVGTL